MGSAVTTLWGGISARNSAKRDAAIQEEETRIAAKEKARDLQSLQAQQALSFAKSGVTTDGSPLLVMEDTKRRGLEEMDDLLRTGFRRAANTRAAGRAAFIGSILKAGDDAARAVGGLPPGSDNTATYNSQTGSAGAKTSTFRSGQKVTWND